MNCANCGKPIVQGIVTNGERYWFHYQTQSIWCVIDYGVRLRATPVSETEARAQWGDR